MLLQRMGRYAEALPLYAQAEKIKTEIIGESHSSYASFLNNRAMLFKMIMGRYAEAQPLYGQAKKIRKTIIAVSQPDYATSLNKCAILLEEMSRSAKALPL